MSTNSPNCHVANIMTFSGVLKGGGQGLHGLVNLLYIQCRPKRCSKFEVADKHDVVLEIIDGRAGQFLY